MVLEEIKQTPEVTILQKFFLTYNISSAADDFENIEAKILKISLNESIVIEKC